MFKVHCFCFLTSGLESSYVMPHIMAMKVKVHTKGHTNIVTLRYIIFKSKDFF